jgi:hypothetical protein
VKTKMKVVDLLGILIENREKHRSIFLEAQAKYRDMAIAQFEKRLAAARAGQRFSVYIDMIEPKDQTKEYDRAIRSLELTTETVIELSEQEFSQLVMDDWAWKHKFLSDTSHYSNRAAEELAGQ